MLSEAFLSTIMYQKVLDGDDGDKENTASRNSRADDARAAQKCHVMTCSTEGGAYKCSSNSPCYQRSSATPSSQAIHIPSVAPADDDTLDLYTSWSSTYASLYKNYPDLHIGGDHILIKKDSGCILDLESEDGPVLLSGDIHSGSLPNESVEEPSEEDTLSSGESHVLPSAPFSNSAINGFLEKKMQELYKQCYEESPLESGASAGGLLWQNVLINISQMSLLISQEQNVERARVRDALLLGQPSGHSSEFLTPVLHISSQANRGRAGASSHNSHLRKSLSLRPPKI